MEDLTPLYNKEFYLAHLCGEDVVLPIPDGNAERYLAYLCGMDVTIPDVPDGRTETYLAYKCGEDVVLPDPMYRIEYYLAKWCGMDCEVPEPLYRIEYWLAQLANSGELKTVTGNPISVSDALARPAESLVIEILPQQSGSGDPSPDNVRQISGFTGVNIQRTGKNLFDKESVKNIISEHDYLDGAYYCDYIELAPNTTVTVSFNAGATSTSIILLNNVEQVNASNYLDLRPSSGSKTFTTDASGRLYIGCLLSETDANFNARIEACNMQIELGSTATAYEPYNGASVEVALGQTVYGGSLDVTTGVLTVTQVSITKNTADMDNGEDWPGWKNSGVRSLVGAGINGAVPNVFSNISPVITSGDRAILVNTLNNLDILLLNKAYFNKTQSEWIALAMDVQIVVPLATPQTYQLTPTEIEMLLGNNVLWNNVDGDMTLEYLADGPADDVDALQILLGNRYVNNGGADEATDKEALEILLGGNTR